MASKSLEQFVEEVGALSVLELAELVKMLEKKFGVSAAMPTMAAPVAAQAAPAAEEKSEFKVELVDSGADKIKVIKAVRQVVKDLSLTDAKKLVESAPTVVAEHVKKADADKMKAELEAAGAKVKLS
ncbi:TPA: 50S ribosomal protein L7/L12 [Candidatus Dependentiae bacterium]|nr:MAG: 50S ribosomal protein L7/L12 [candidate division TM6 bacterium GW2011_GWF2_43_87]HBL98426.1 50S ribosomal protein L7/L12 [Candidatus Dependentiae bacterium]